MTSIERTHSDLTIRTSPRFDFAACEQLQVASERELAAGFSSLTVDLSNTVYIDSAALGMLLYMDHVSGENLHARIVGARARVLDAIRTMHLDKVLDVVM